MNIFLETLTTEWEHTAVIIEDDRSDGDVDTQLFLESAFHIARLMQTEE